ncbi:MAG: PaREP1 family protein [Pyrobaculum arsenaticum]|uniref:PaREP1 family protein n=1 Tax=Pyrobaculum arsenaticum TaxID=121277 RepID=UPI002276CE78|nr:PaREP1 family protein [Pyrobaculum arsenaticum]
MAAVVVPKSLYEEAVRRGVDLEELIIKALSDALKLDPASTARARLELAAKYLEEGKAFADKDPVQASGKLYKAAEETVKALAHFYALGEILRRVEERGRWSVADLAKAVSAISKRLGEWFMHSWDAAWALHVWGFHEAKLDAEDIRDRLPYIEKMVKDAQKALSSAETP